jgi:hypothetical protein
VGDRAIAGVDHLGVDTHQGHIAAENDVVVSGGGKCSEQEG